MALAPDVRDHLREFAQQLDAADHGMRRALFDSLMKLYGWSRDTAYARLKEAGWTSGRKTRADKGRTSCPEGSLVTLGSMGNESLRLNGKQTMFLSTAISVATQSGVDVPVGQRQVSRLLKARRLDVGSQRAAEPVQGLRAPHPNHTHEVDPSLCLLFYMKGKQHLVRDDEFYKNKLDKFVKEVKLKVWRYVAYDRASGVLAVRYFEAAGENQANMFEFLHWAWSPKPELTWYGAPRFLFWDKGSANTATSVRNWLTAMEVTAIEHTAGNARAKGGVENGNNIVETMFESRLRFSPVDSVEELNRAVWAWCEAMNANRIPNQDTRLSRPQIARIARYDLWTKIRADELRVPPAIEVCQILMSGKLETRKVRRDLTISYRHPQADAPRIYCLEGLKGLCATDTVEIKPLVYGECAILITVPQAFGEAIQHRVEPNVAFDEYGQRLDAPVIGEEYKSVANTDIERARREMDKAAFPGVSADQVREQRRKGVTPFGGELDAIAHLHEIERTQYMPKKATEINVRAPVIEAQRLSIVETCKELMARGVKVTDLYTWVSDRYPEGVVDSDLDGIAQVLRGAETAKLRAVGGA